MKFEANIIFRGKIKCLTGLHIGGSKDKLEIGGVDSPVLRDPITKQPYLPGSSIKGRMRALLEYSLGVVSADGKPSSDPLILQLFGTSADDQTEAKDFQHPGPTPLIVRDATADKATVEKWEGMDSELLFTEYKSENFINRITSAANPRFLERVVAGSIFDFEMVYTVLNPQKEGKDYREVVNANLKHLLLGLRLIEDNSLGKSGSRGYGKVEFYLADPLVITNEDYLNNTDTYKMSKLPEQLVLKPLAAIDTPTYPAA